MKKERITPVILLIVGYTLIVVSILLLLLFIAIAVLLKDTEGWVVVLEVCLCIFGITLGYIAIQESERMVEAEVKKNKPYDLSEDREKKFRESYGRVFHHTPGGKVF